MPVNERFLEKAEKLKRELLHRSVTAESDGRELNSGDEVFISQFPGLKEDDNPILMFAELK